MSVMMTPTHGQHHACFVDLYYHIQQSSNDNSTVGMSQGLFTASQTSADSLHGGLYSYLHWDNVKVHISYKRM